jgi:hypothetical protein
MARGQHHQPLPLEVKNGPLPTWSAPADAWAIVAKAASSSCTLQPSDQNPPPKGFAGGLH